MDLLPEVWKCTEVTFEVTGLDLHGDVDGYFRECGTVFIVPSMIEQLKHISITVYKYVATTKKGWLLNRTKYHTETEEHPCWRISLNSGNVVYIKELPSHVET